MTGDFLSLSAILPGLRAEMLFDRGATWRWRPGAVETSNPIAAWRAIGFNDAAFTAAPSPFWLTPKRKDE